MSDEDVIDLPSEFLPEAVRREMAKRRREAIAPPAAAAVPQPVEAGPEMLPPIDALSPLPSPGDPYKAYARPANQMVPTLFVLTGDGKIWGFPYSARMEGPHMLPGEPGQGDCIILRLNVGVLVQVTLAGQCLDELLNYLADHRIRWVREVPKGRIVQAGGMPVISRVVIDRAESWPPLGMA